MSEPAAGNGRWRFVGNYPVLQRTGELAIKFIRIETIDKAAVDDQLVAAMLRSDRQRVVEILQTASEDGCVDDLTQAVCRHVNIIALIFDRVCELELEDQLARLRLSDGSIFLDRLRQEAAVAISRFAGLDQQFSQLTQQLADFERAIVWLKGPVLARSLYREPYFRLSEDFDIFVRWDMAQAVFERLRRLGFQPIFDDPGHCHQFGIGPVGSLAALAVRPSEEFEYCHNLSLSRIDSPLVEMKFDPLEQGLKMQELDRFARSAKEQKWHDQPFLAPDNIDHLILELTHLHKHFFTGWQWLYDVHLLVLELNKRPDDWHEFVRRCRVESVIASAWSGLDLVRDWLGTPVPDKVLDELTAACRPARITFLCGTEFLWNTTSLPELLFEAIFSGDRIRKLAVLRQSLFPSAEFLSRYYCRGARVDSLNYPFIWCLHFWVLLLPGGLVRRLFGWLWLEPTKTEG